MGTMQTVNIPNDHFAKQTTNIYSKPLEALLREVLQNSVDAGATRFDIFTEDNLIMFKDNGCGMDEETLKDGMLTMSGSIKGEGATGGFGAAKELILFAQESYEIETRNIYAYGSCLNYMLEYKSEITGTSITIIPHMLFEYHESTFQNVVKEYIKDCEFDCKCYLNNEYISQNPKGDLFRELNWGKIYMQEVEGTMRMRIRHNGLLMFDRRVSETKYSLTIELKGNSTNVLTTSRDSLRWTQAEELDDLVLELQRAGGEFGRLFNHELTYRGRMSFIKRMEELDNYYEAQESYSKIVDFIPEEIHETTSMTEQVQILEKVAASLTIPDEIKEEVKKLKTVIEGVTENDFKIRVEKKNMDEIPEEIRPGKMKKRFDLVAKWWKAALQEVGRVSPHTMASKYAIGFILSDDTTALYSSGNDGVCYYVNPYSKGFNNIGSNTKSQNQMIVTACHEAAHTITQYHDEYWQNAFQDAVVEMMTNSNMKKVKDIVKYIEV